MSLLGEPGNPDREEDLRHSDPPERTEDEIRSTLDRVTDVVLAHKPKPKTKAAKKRDRRKKRKSGK